MSTSDSNDVPEAMGEVREAFIGKLQEAYDQPSTTTIPEDETYDGKPFRFQLDNLISVLEDAHREHIMTNRIPDERNIVRNILNMFTLCCRKAKDKNAAKIFYRYAMHPDDPPPRVAWWTASSTDWICTIDSARVDFSGFIQSKTNTAPPHLPIGLIYREAMAMREQSESNPQVLAPIQALFCAKIAKYFYGTMRASIELLTEGSPGEEARVKQCTRKVEVVKKMLEEATGEDEDFMDVILSQFAGIGPDGEKISTKSIRKALGTAMSTGVLFDITSAIPEVMKNATDAESAKESLLNMPAIKKLVGGGAHKDSITNLFTMLQGADGFNPMNGSGAAASSSNSNSPTPTTTPVSLTRKSVQKK